MNILPVLVLGPQILLLSCCQATVQPAGDEDLLLAFKSTFTNGDEALADWRVDTNPCPDYSNYPVYSDSGWIGIMCNSDGQVTNM